MGKRPFRANYSQMVPALFRGWLAGPPCVPRGWETEQRLAAGSSSQVSRPPLHWLATAKSNRELHFHIRHCGRFVLALRRTRGRGVPGAGDTLSGRYTVPTEVVSP